MTYAGETFTRCPVTYQTKETLLVMRLAQDGYLERAPWQHLFQMPAKKLAALRFATYLVKTKELSRT